MPNINISRAHYREDLFWGLGYIDERTGKRVGVDDIVFSKENLFTFDLVIGVPKGRVWQAAVSNELIEDSTRGVRRGL